MKIEVIENKKDKLKIKVHESLTLVNIINENLWKQKIDYAAYKVDHPYLEQPEIVVKSANPKKSLMNAAEQIIADVKETRKQFQHTLKK